jgi:hypothetical protein
MNDMDSDDQDQSARGNLGESGRTATYRSTGTYRRSDFLLVLGLQKNVLRDNAPQDKALREADPQEDQRQGRDFQEILTDPWGITDSVEKHLPLASASHARAITLLTFTLSHREAHTG